MEEVAGVQEGDIGGCHAVYAQDPWARVLVKLQASEGTHDIPTASVRSVGVLQVMWASSPAAEAPAAVKETILECGQTTSVSIPSALLVEAAAGAGLLLNRAGTVNERRPLFSGGGACSGDLEGASGEDMVSAHACISSPGVLCYVFAAHRRRCSRRTCRTVAILCVG